jgi:hypothetical protein
VPTLGLAPAGTKPKDEDEMRKTLMTATIEGHSAIFFDNIKGHLDSEALEGFLTSQDFSGRILGLSKSFRGENNAVVFLTGNGCTLSPDMRRRSLQCEIFSEEERPEDRVFQNKLEVPTLLSRRAEILGALLAIIQDWDKSGRPKPSRSNSSFPEWAEIIGGIVEHAGYGCPLEAPKIEASADQAGADMRMLVSELGNCSQSKLVKFEDIIEVARKHGLFEGLVREEGEPDAKAKASLGLLLKRYDRRLIGDHRFSLEGKGHQRRFRVEAVKHGSTVSTVFQST